MHDSKTIHALLDIIGYITIHSNMREPTVMPTHNDNKLMKFYSCFWKCDNMGVDLDDTYSFKPIFGSKYVTRTQPSPYNYIWFFVEPKSNILDWFRLVIWIWLQFPPIVPLDNYKNIFGTSTTKHVPKMMLKLYFSRLASQP